MFNDITQNNREKRPHPLVAVIMGSESDLVVMKNAADVLEKLEIPYEIKVVSAHRTPERMVAYSKEAKSRGLEIIIAGAGGAAHLPGMVASLTPLPVIGVPVKLKALEGMDALLSIAQMPGGVPVATVGIDNAKNAALLAARILGIKYPEIQERLELQMAQVTASVVYDLENHITR